MRTFLCGKSSLSDNKRNCYPPYPAAPTHKSGIPSEWILTLGGIKHITGENNGFPFLDILGYLKNTHKNPKFGKVRQVPTREFPTKFPDWDVSLFQIWDFYAYSLNTLKYPKMGIRYFFLCIGGNKTSAPFVFSSCSFIPRADLRRV